MAAWTAAVCAYATFEPHARLRRPFPRLRFDLPDDMFGTVTATSDNSRCAIAHSHWMRHFTVCRRHRTSERTGFAGGGPLLHAYE